MDWKTGEEQYLANKLWENMEASICTAQNIFFTFALPLAIASVAMATWVSFLTLKILIGVGIPVYLGQFGG